MKIEILTSPCSKGTLVGNGGGPAAVLHAGLLATLQADGHDVAGPRAATLRSGASAGDEMAVIEEAGASLAQLVREARGRGAFCLVLEGDCTAAPAVIAGLEADGRVGVLWLDSHGDFNTPETTPSGLLGGMPVAVATGRCHPWWRQAVGLATPLQEGDVVAFDYPTERPVDIAINGKLKYRGEIVTTGRKRGFHILEPIVER